jgi:proteasome assembly chaperone (PAC2) family protein
MATLSYQSRPQLRRPIMVVGFQGWSDAGEAATSSVGYLRKLWNARVFASVDPEDFYDFQVTRPQVKVNEEGVREITWPTTDFAHAAVPDADRDVILLLGIEPSMRWATFTKLVTEVAHDNNVELLVALGALLAGRPHTRPIRVTGSASTPELAAKYGLATPRYEGPTGIAGVVIDACRRESIDAVTLWGWVPHYLQGGPSPTATLALLQRLATLLELSIDLTDLEQRARAHDERVSEAVRTDPDIVATVEELERQADAEDLNELPSGEELAAEVERFLRNQPGDR